VSGNGKVGRTGYCGSGGRSGGSEAFLCTTASIGASPSAAIVSSRSDDAKHEYAQHYRNVGNFLANFEVRCFVPPEEARILREAWVRTEAELRLYRLPPERRRALLVDPEDGPQRFLTLKRRLQMLREIDDHPRQGAQKDTHP
jgi:hypothetical protein